MIATGRAAPADRRVTPRASARPTVRPRVLVVGPLPPPVHGCSVFTELLLESRFADEFDTIHIDITDPRDVRNIGRFDVRNVWLAGRHGAAFGRHSLRRPHVAYIPVAQNTWGYLRDSLFLASAALCGLRFIVQFHGDGFGEFHRNASPPVRASASALLRRARTAIVQGESLVRMLDGIVPRDRIAVVPNGVPDMFAGGVQRDVHTASDARVGRPCVLFLSNLSPAKGYIDLVEAAVRLLSNGLDADFVFAGAVADAAAYERARRSCSDYADRIRFEGVADAARKQELLRSADILALPSHSEAHPLVILEAMSAALPVVSTRRGAIPETVVDGVTGILVEPRDGDALASGLARLIGEPALRVDMGRAGRARYLANYTAERWVEGMIGVFRSVLDDESAARA